MKHTLLIFLFMVTACGKEKVVEPGIESISVNYINSSGYNVVGRINELGTRTISDHGFIISSSQWAIIDVTSDTKKVSLGIPSKTGYVAIMIPALRPNNFYARMYIVTDKGTIYGNVISYIRD